MNIHDITKQLRAFADELDAVKATEQPAPFTLPPAPPGIEWHRKTGWKAEDLPQGTRPLVEGEHVCKGDWCWNQSCKWRESDNWKGSPDVLAKRHLYRTTRPLLFQHEGHEWTWHRAGDPMPCDGERMVLGMTFHSGAQRTPTAGKNYLWEVNDRNPLIGWRYADTEKPDPKQPLGPEDVPPGSVFRFKGSDDATAWQTPLELQHYGVCFHNGSGSVMWKKWGYPMLNYEINRSIPLTGKWNPEAWEACER